jgi:hypothetical protein
MRLMERVARHAQGTQSPVTEGKPHSTFFFSKVAFSARTTLGDTVRCRCICRGWSGYTATGTCTRRLLEIMSIIDPRLNTTALTGNRTGMLCDAKGITLQFQQTSEIGCSSDRVSRSASFTTRRLRSRGTLSTKESLEINGWALQLDYRMGARECSWHLPTACVSFSCCGSFYL